MRTKHKHPIEALLSKIQQQTTEMFPFHTNVYKHSLLSSELLDTLGCRSWFWIEKRNMASRFVILVAHLDVFLDHIPVSPGIPQ